MIDHEDSQLNLDRHHCVVILVQTFSWLGDPESALPISINNRLALCHLTRSATPVIPPPPDSPFSSLIAAMVKYHNFLMPLQWEDCLPSAPVVTLIVFFPASEIHRKNALGGRTTPMIQGWALRILTTSPSLNICAIMRRIE